MPRGKRTLYSNYSTPAARLNDKIIFARWSPSETHSFDISIPEYIAEPVSVRPEPTHITVCLVCVGCDRTNEFNKQLM